MLPNFQQHGYIAYKLMNRNLIVVLFAIMLAYMPTHFAEANGNQSGKWAKGMVILVDGTELSGDIRYDWRSNGVRFRDVTNRQRAYSVQQVQRFSYFDNDENRVRQFAAVDFPINVVMTRPVFMEEVLTGTLTVYRRPYNHRKPTPVTSVVRYVLGGWLVSDHETFDYFVYTNQAFTRLDQFSHQFWPKMQKESNGAVWAYLTADHRISPVTLTGQLRLIARYNEMPHAVDPVLAE